MRTNSAESPRALLRLLIDGIVEGLSRCGTAWRRRSVQKPTPRLGLLLGLLLGHDIDVTVKFMAK
jgi:hypothetical protein